MKRLALCLLMSCGLAQAAVYKYIDQNGNVTFSNIPIKGGKPIRLEPISTYSSQTPVPHHNKTHANSASSANGSPAGYPNVDAGTQRQRDGGRRKILEQELSNEEQALADARKALADGQATRNGDETHNYQKYLDRVQKLKDAVTDREKNIQALRRELGQNRQ
ncbi:MAG TPA: DUF4124 domain-containing protein [Chromobacteriaceae bacterium]|nr:DUF4124 domain-containing protein [Chromobacteriaceae bacterium]